MDDFLGCFGFLLLLAACGLGFFFLQGMVLSAVGGVVVLVVGSAVVVLTAGPVAEAFFDILSSLVSMLEHLFSAGKHSKNHQDREIEAEVERSTTGLFSKDSSKDRSPDVVLTGQLDTSHSEERPKKKISGLQKLSSYLLPLGILALAGYMLLGEYHIVSFQKKWHFVEKERHSFQHTYLDLDKQPQLWKVVAMSPKLSKYMKTTYPKASLKHLKAHPQDILGKVKQLGKKKLQKVEG